MQQFRFRLLLLWLTALSAAACSDPGFSGFDPPRGRPRSLVRLQVTKMPVASVIWDAGEHDERPIAVSLKGPWISIPEDAEPGDHPVEIAYWGGRTKTQHFTVDGDPLQLDHPRIDHVMSLFTQFDAGQTNTALYIQGANFEIGAVVEIGGVEVPTLAHKAMLNDLYGVPEESLGYPIHHYVSMIAMPGLRNPGDELSIVVRNPDNVTSVQAVTYTVPGPASELDSDGDSLTDAWEEAGHDSDGDGVNDADPFRRDIFVELDVMDSVLHPPEATTASQMGTIDAVKAMFAAAPFLNPFTDSGIHAVFELGTTCAVDSVEFDINLPANSAAPGCGGLQTTFSQLKNAYFDRKNLGDVYHYVIWAKRELAANTGQSDMPLGALHLPGDDAMVSIGDDPVYFSPRTMAELLAHELGHNLAQKHGGTVDDDEYTPNYWTVMSYTWVLRTDLTGAQRRDYATCLPFYYAKANETEVGTQVPRDVGMVLNYSAGMGKQIVESDGSLDETKGVCGQEIDWNEDGTPGPGYPATENSLNADANEDGDELDTLNDFANWRALRFDGPRLNGTIVP